MIGYIYHIVNIETGKAYVGQTIDIDWRLKKHFLALRNGNHHSDKLQRSFDLHGEDKFKIDYEQREFETYQDLLNAEMLEISKYNSYEDGYNETRGGEGHATIFDFNTMVLLYNIGQRYDGVQHRLAEYYGCDRTSIKAVFRKDYLKAITYDEEDLNKLIAELGLTEKNLKENYINNYDRKLTTEQVLDILSTMEVKKYSGAACGRVFHVGKDVISGITRGKTYKEDYKIFISLSEEEKIKRAENFCNNTDVIRLHYQGQRGSVKNPLTQEQVNYILDNKALKSKTQIAKDLGISTDRVSSVCLEKSYLDMIWVYNKEHSFN